MQLESPEGPGAGSKTVRTADRDYVQGLPWSSIILAERSDSKNSKRSAKECMLYPQSEALIVLLRKGWNMRSSCERLTQRCNSTFEKHFASLDLLAFSFQQVFSFLCFEVCLAYLGFGVSDCVVHVKILRMYLLLK